MNGKQLFCQKTIHEDPYSIKKTNISVFLFTRPLEIGNAGPQLRISHYITPRFMLLFNGYYGLVTDSKGWDEWGPPKQYQKFLLNALEIDLHLIDHSKNKALYIYRPDTTIQGNAYTKINSPVRRILCFTGGIQSLQNREKLTNKKAEDNNTNQIPMIDLHAGKDTIINYAKISTNTSYTNILLGLKFKSISAAVVKFKDDNSLNDMHFETYASLIIPISYYYSKDLHNNFSEVPTHRLHDYKPKPGFKVGVFNRNSIKDNWSFGAECGIEPSLFANYLRGTFIHLSIGISLNFGKISYSDISSI